jgi:hypothetical protein
MKSWKTNLLGLATVLGAVANFITDIANGNPVDLMTTITAITAGIGLMFARDNKVTSEDVGAK